MPYNKLSIQRKSPINISTNKGIKSSCIEMYISKQARKNNMIIKYLKQTTTVRFKAMVML